MGNSRRNRGPKKTVRAKDPRTHDIAQTTTPAQQPAKAASHAVQTRPKSETGATSSGPSRARSIAQDRAKHAWDTVQEVSKWPDKDAKDFGGQAKKLPMRIRAAGLGQALAFVRAKAKPGTSDEKAGPKRLLESLSGWVLPRLQPGITTPADDVALLNAILSGDATFLRRATLEAMAWLEWVNRFAEAEGLGDDHDTSND